MLARAVFYPTLLYNVLMEKVSSRNWYDRIDDTVLLGALPFRKYTQQLVDENVKGIVTVNEEHETRYFVNTKEEWLALGIEQIRLETTDFVAAPNQHQLQRGVNFILKYRQQGDSVYVHCKAGRSRSATLVACYLMQVHGWKPEEAVDYIRGIRPHILIRNAQWKALNQYYNNEVENRIIK